MVEKCIICVERGKNVRGRFERFVCTASVESKKVEWSCAARAAAIR
jgi:hypothetical protein